MNNAKTKWCTACKTRHPVEAFGKDTSRSDGLRAQCIQSRKIKRKTPEQRFLEKTLSAKNGCVEWTGSTYPTGYGSFYFNGKIQPAHRVAWILSGNEIPTGQYILHKCDNRKCVNVEHLFLGTHQDNMDDMARKGRRWSASGISNPNARLSTEKVSKILADKRSLRVIAADYGVSKTQIRNIKIGRHWKKKS